MKKITNSKITPLKTNTSKLFHSIASLIQQSRQRAAVAVNSELAMLYWHIGRIIRIEVLKERRAEYGKQIIEDLSLKLTESFGKGGEKNI